MGFFFMGKGTGSVYLIPKSKLIGLVLQAFLSASIHSALRFSVAFFSTYTLITFSASRIEFSDNSVSFCTISLLLLFNYFYICIS